MSIDNSFQGAKWHSINLNLDDDEVFNLAQKNNISIHLSKLLVNRKIKTISKFINSKLKEKGVKTNFVFVHHNPDSTFPNGIPNPLLEENRSSTTNAVIEEKADFGVAFDGDFDRCFFFDHFGNFIPGE